MDKYGLSSQVEEDEQDAIDIKEDRTYLRIHKRCDRRPMKKVKKVHGYNCKACGFNFEKSYGSLGRWFIEAHHLTPFAELKGKIINLDPMKDFTVLCSNCHSMIHKFDKPHDLAAFRRVLS